MGKSKGKAADVRELAASMVSGAPPFAPRALTRNRHFQWIAFLFALSGACGLIYQVIWSRLLVLVFGSATHAIATVLGVFFLGLALGSFLAGKFMKRTRFPLKLYGYLELGIGLYALAFHPLLEGAQFLHHALFPSVYDSAPLLAVTRILIATAVLLPPTVLMGATVPLIGDFLTRSPDHVGRDYGLIFSINTLGAAAGSFLSAFYLIPSLGLQTTTWIAAAMNLGIGAASVALGKDSPAAENPAQGTQIAPEAPRVSRGQAYACLFAFALTGFLGLVYEVAWSRALILVFGTSVYAFATMLTTYLVGLALGSMVMGRYVDRFRNLVAAFAVVQIVVGVAVFASTVAIGWLPGFLVGHFRVDTPWQSVMFLEFGLCFAIMVVPAFGSGMLFPLVARIFMGQRGLSIGRTIADSYAVNTIGCIAGSFAAGFLFIPWIGIENTLLVGAGTNLLLAAWLVSFSREWSRGMRSATAALLVAAGVAGALGLKTWRPLVMNSGVYVYGEALARMGKGIESFVENYRLLFYREGHSATVAVLESPRGRFLRVNGKTDGGTLTSGQSDDLTQSFLGLLPNLYNPKAKQGLVIGLGTGMTLNAMIANEKMEVDCIEISPAVAEAAAFFKEANGNAPESDRVKVRLLDGRTWLDAIPNAYDLIVSEPSHPWQTGNANLFTQDFFHAAQKRLKPEGLFCQWLPYYQMEPEHFKILIHTLRDSFPYVNIWVVNTDAIVIGSQKPLRLDWPTLMGLRLKPSYRRIFDHLGIQTLPQLMSFFYLDADAVGRMLGDVAQVNSDDHPLIEYSAPKYLLRKERGEAFLEILGHSLASRLPLDNAPPGLDVESPRVLAREGYFSRWGFDRSVFELMMRNYPTR